MAKWLVSAPTGEKMSYKEVADYCTDIGKNLNKTLNGQLWCSLNPGIGWRSGGKFNLGQQAKLFSFDSYTDDENYKDITKIKFKSLFLVVSVSPKKKKPTKGGCDNETNDCLYDAIIASLNTTRRLPVSVNSAYKLKCKLKLSRDSKIDIALIPKIEQLMKTRINVTGDHSHVSSSDFFKKM